jgi:hypothetical protein
MKLTVSTRVCAHWVIGEQATSIEKRSQETLAHHLAAVPER